MRLSSPALADALIQGLTAAGADVLDIGLCGTEEVYFTTFEQNTDGGIMVTASHNPRDYNGLKFVRAQARPIASDSGLFDIEARVYANDFADAETPGRRHAHAHRERYIRFLLDQIRTKQMQPLKIVANPGNGCAGLVADLREQELPFEIVRMHYEPDGHLPNGIPNPLLPENRAATAAQVRACGADFGVAWDGDFDRCFFFDENGDFIESYYIVGLIARTLLAMQPGGRIVYDPRLVWNTQALVTEHGGEPVLSRSGHSFMKQRMREVDAIYGGEMSAHHYFRDFAYADNGQLPWLLIAQLISESARPLSALV